MDLVTITAEAMAAQLERLARGHYVSRTTAREAVDAYRQARAATEVLDTPEPINTVERERVTARWPAIGMPADLLPDD